MQWQQTSKEGPGCNQLPLSALGHRPKNTEECHYALPNSELKGRVQQFWFTSFTRTANITGFLPNMTLPQKLGNPAPVYILSFRHTEAAFLSHYATDFLAEKKKQKGFSYFFNSGECYTVQKQANAVLSSLKRYNTFMSSFTLSFQSLRRVLITQLKVTYKNHLKTA